MKKILFVCHGNICRSPMAEMIMKSIVKSHNKENEYLIDSVATSLEEIGNSIYPPAVSVMRKNNIEIEPHYAKRITISDYNKYDLIICMDRMNIRNLERVIGRDVDNKIKLFKEYCGWGCEDVADPWYTDNFDLCFKEINELCHDLYTVLDK